MAPASPTLRSDATSCIAIEQAVATVPVHERLLGEARMVRIMFAALHFAPRRLEIKTDVDALGRFRQRRVDRRRMRMHEIRPLRIVQPQRAAAALAEVATAAAGPALAILLDTRAIHAKMLAALDLERLLPCAEIDRITAA